MPSYKKLPESMKECPGPECQGCSSANCYAHGGGVNKKAHSVGQFTHDNEKRGSSPQSGSNLGGVSEAGESYRHSKRHGGTGSAAKEIHRENISELKSQKKPNLYAEGGSVSSWTKREDNERGVHKPIDNHGHSALGLHSRGAKIPVYDGDKEASLGAARKEANSTLHEMRSMKKPNLYAEGGEVSEHEEHDESPDHELNEMLGDELMGAFEAKDKKRVMEGIEAIVLSCMNKE